MTEENILFDLECCWQKKCSNCSRNGIVGCSDQLRRDTANVVMFQQRQLKDAIATIDEQRREIKELESKCLAKYSEADIVEAVNRIITTRVVGEDIADLLDAITHLLGMFNATAVIEIDKKYNIQIVLKQVCDSL